MVAVPKPTAGEAALYAILTDPTGVDFVEFALKMPGAPFGRYRLRPYQWLWWTDLEQYLISACARDVGKSQGILARAMVHPFASPGFDMFIGAPTKDHLNPLVDDIEERLTQVRLVDEMLQKRQGKSGISRSPSFQATFRNGAKIITRLPKATGKGFKGMHAKYVIIDEGQDLNTAGYTELAPTFLAEIPGSQKLIYGVTTGLGDDFDYHASSGELYKRWQKIAPERPTWGEKERKAKMSEFKSTESGWEYQRNIFGETSGTNSDNFVPSRLMACVRRMESEWAEQYNEQIYQYFEIEAERLLAFEKKAIDMVQLPSVHLDKKYLTYWMGIDIGLVKDDTEILVAGWDGGVYRLLTRITMRQIPSPHQIKVIEKVLSFYGDRVARLTMDKTGVGLPIFEHLVALGDWHQQRIRGLHFSEKVVAGMEDRERKPGEKLKDLDLKQDAKSLGLDALRELVDDQKLELPFDQSLIRSWLGVDTDHALDAGRMLGASIKLYDVDTILELRKPAPPPRIWGAA